MILTFITPTPIWHRFPSPSNLKLHDNLHFHTQPRFSLHPSISMSAANPPTPRKITTNPPIPKRSLPTLPRELLLWRWRVFATMLLSYAVYYLTRFSFPFSAPVMQSSIGLSLEQVGLISSCFPAVYGVSKLFGGVTADLGSPRTILALGLILAAFCNLAFACGNTVPFFAVIWALNGLVSSVGFPACAKLLSTWFSQSERGTYWGILNVSLNVGGALSPVIVGTAASTLGWRYGMLIPAAMALVTGAFAYVAIADSPRAAGLSSHPSLPAELPTRKKVNKAQGNGTGVLEVFRSQLVDGVLRERAVWYLAAAYFFVYIIRQALTSWTVFYLMQARGVPTLVEAGIRVSGLELGGLVGSISSGWLSDRLISRNPNAGVVGQRMRVILLYLCLTAVAITGFFYIPVTKALLPVQWALFALAGMGLYGPQLLVGLSGTECVDRRYAGTSNGFVGFLAYAGAALAGLPLTLCVKQLGWNSLLVVLLGCCAVIALLIIPLLQKKSYEQMQNERSTPVALKQS